jgi:hypothetical protein
MFMLPPNPLLSFCAPVAPASVVAPVAPPDPTVFVAGDVLPV